MSSRKDTTMVFGKTDINFVIGGEFSKLDNATKAIYHVVTAIASFANGQFFHSADQIADLAGYSHNSVDRALAQLLERKVISVVLQRPGETTLYAYNFVADGADRGGHSTIDPRPIPHAAQPPPSPMSQGRPMHESPPDPPMSREQDLFNEMRTTTAADRISSSLITRMISRFGENRVQPVVVAMRSMDGEVKDANAYFCSAVTKGYVPTSKSARGKEEKKRKDEARASRQEEFRQEYDQMVREYEESDPIEVQREIAKANRLLGIK